MKRLLFFLLLCCLFATTITAQNVITVINGNDSGSGSLRQAITDVPDGGIISFKPGLTITLASELTLGSKSVTIDATGNCVTISGNNACRIFSILGQNNKTYSLKGLTMSNGYTSDNGGAICGDITQGFLNVTNCSLIHNTATVDGGGIYVYGNCIFNNCIFNKNSSTIGAGGGAFIFSANVLTNCIFSENYAKTYGGGVLSYLGGLSVNCVFLQNSCSQNGGGANALLGGAFINCTFKSNSATLSGGGAINSINGSNAGSFTNCLFWGNTADNFSTYGSGSANFNFCAIPGGYPGIGNVNIMINPFISDTDLSLNNIAGGGLSCINTGNSAINSTTTDINGFPRKSGIIDIGAYESTSTSLIGSGTEANPYQIASLSDLKYLSDNSSIWNKFFIQTADIDASSTSLWYNGIGWYPIGNESTNFTGIYNGQGHSISGLTINRPGSNNLGLFGYAIGCTIKNLAINNANIIGYDFVGSLIGFCGLNSNIENCHSSGHVKGNQNVGGLAGLNHKSQISKCFSSCSASGNVSIGSLVGLNTTYALINNCYSIGSASGINYIGGLVGQNSQSGIVYSFSTGYVTGSIFGGLVGINNQGTIESSFYDTQVSGENEIHEGTKLSSDQMKDIKTFTNASWDFDYTWAMTSIVNGGYPCFISQLDSASWVLPSVTTGDITLLSDTSATFRGNLTNLGDPQPYKVGFFWATSPDSLNPDDGSDIRGLSSTGSYSETMYYLRPMTTYYVWSYAVNAAGITYGNRVEFFSLKPTPPANGNGTEKNPYQIATWQDLFWLSQTSSVWGYGNYFVQTADIRFPKNITSWNNNQGWSPIGNSTTNFMGSYNGQNHTITGLYISRSASDYQGLFGFVYYSTIQNIGLIGVNVSGHNYVGGLIGQNALQSNVSNCYFAGTVNGYSYVGGLVGNNDYKIQYSYSTGTVNGSYNIGGLVGQNRSLISNCFSLSNVNGTSYSGGLVGWNANAITNCYSTGVIKGNIAFGGLVGYGDPSSVNNSFWDQESSVMPISAGGTAKTTTEMKTTATFTNASWDFKWETTNGTNDIWGINNSLNNGYPYLSWQFSVSVNKNFDNQVISKSSVICVNASDTITVAGSGSVYLLNGSSTTFIAGKSIRFLNGFNATSGCFMDAYITTDNSFCDKVNLDPSSPVINEKSVEYSPVRVPDMQKKEGVVIYPNPNNGSFTITTNGLYGNSEVTVYNLLGSRIFETIFTDNNQLNVTLPTKEPGIYFVKINNGKNQYKYKISVK